MLRQGGRRVLQHGDRCDNRRSGHVGRSNEHRDGHGDRSRNHPGNRHACRYGRDRASRRVAQHGNRCGRRWIAVAAARRLPAAPVETSLPPSGLESSVNVDVSRSQANASPATVASSDAKVEGSGRIVPALPWE